MVTGVARHEPRRERSRRRRAAARRRPSPPRSRPAARPGAAVRQVEHHEAARRAARSRSHSTEPSSEPSTAITSSSSSGLAQERLDERGQSVRGADRWAPQRSPRTARDDVPESAGQDSFRYHLPGSTPWLTRPFLSCLPNYNNEASSGSALDRLAANTTTPTWRSDRGRRRLDRRQPAHPAPLARLGRLPGEVRLIEKANSGAIDALNTALEAARGEFCVQLDSDASIETPGWVEAMLELMLRRRRGGVVTAKVVMDHGIPARLRRRRRRARRLA